MNDPEPGTHDDVKSLKCLLMYAARDIKNTPPPIGLHLLWGLTVSVTCFPDWICENSDSDHSEQADWQGYEILCHIQQRNEFFL